MSSARRTSTPIIAIATPRHSPELPSSSSQASTSRASESYDHSPAPPSPPRIPAPAFQLQPNAEESHPSVSHAVLQHWHNGRPPTPTITPTQTSGSTSTGPGTQPQQDSMNDAEPFRTAQESWFRSTLSSLGIGRGATPMRKSEMSLLWNLCWGLAQVRAHFDLCVLKRGRCGMTT